jgi:hypothetical protein
MNLGSRQLVQTWCACGYLRCVCVCVCVCAQYCFVMGWHVVWDVVLIMFLNCNWKLKALNILSAIKKHHSLPFIQVKTSCKDEYGPKILRYTIRRGFNALTIQIFVFKCTKSHKHQLVFILTINWNSPYIQGLRLSFRTDPYVSRFIIRLSVHLICPCVYVSSSQPSLFLNYFIFFIYSHVHTLFGSFLHPVPPPRLSSRQVLFCPYH